uniref:Transmembrane protein 241 n=1 Tax=Astyanax mexicanus TaxID=7994 RepID=A0A8B9H0J6_ASTMX
MLYNQFGIHILSLSVFILAVSLFILYVYICFFFYQYVLSVLKFTYPTLFLGWQTCTGTLLLVVTGKLGWVEVKGFTRSAAVLWLPGSVLFLGNIYGGSKALSMLPIPFFFVLQNVSEVVFILIIRVTQRERSSWMKLFSQVLVLVSALTLILHNPQFGPNAYGWATVHLFCIGSYRAFQRNSKSSHLRLCLRTFFDTEFTQINIQFQSLFISFQINV